MNESLEVQVLTFLQAVREAKKLTEDHPDYTVAKEVEGLFTGAVDFLRSTFPNQALRRLAGILWDAVEYKVTPLIYGMSVRTLGFARDTETPRAFIAPPADWNNKVRKDPITQLGAVVFVGSQAVDYVNERYTIDPQNVLVRARANEAEFMNTVKGLSPDWDLSSYYEELLKEFPEGLSTPRAHKVLYQLNPLISA